MLIYSVFIIEQNKVFVQLAELEGNSCSGKCSLVLYFFEKKRLDPLKF